MWSHTSRRAVAGRVDFAASILRPVPTGRRSVRALSSPSSAEGGHWRAPSWTHDAHWEYRRTVARYCISGGPSVPEKQAGRDRSDLPDHDAERIYVALFRGRVIVLLLEIEQLRGHVPPRALERGSSPRGVQDDR